MFVFPAFASDAYSVPHAVYQAWTKCVGLLRLVKQALSNEPWADDKVVYSIGALAPLHFSNLPTSPVGATRDCAYGVVELRISRWWYGCLAGCTWNMTSLVVARSLYQLTCICLSCCTQICLDDVSSSLNITYCDNRYVCGLGFTSEI